MTENGFWLLVGLCTIILASAAFGPVGAMVSALICYIVNKLRNV